jgi:hypothetical protein
VARGSDRKEDVILSDEASGFVSAASEPDKALGVDSDTETERDHPRGKLQTHLTSLESFETASSRPPDIAQPEEQVEASPSKVPTGEEQQSQKAQGKRPVSTVESTNTGPSRFLVEVPSVDAESTTSLLHKTDVNKVQPAPETEVSKGMRDRIKRRSGLSDSADATRTRSNLRNLVKFDIPEDSKRAELHLKAKAAQMTIRHASTRLRRQKLKDGLVVKMERMLVRVDKAGSDVPDDFDENGDQKIDSRVKDKWREYMVVCRQSISEEADFVLQMYKTRVC